METFTSSLFMVEILATATFFFVLQFTGSATGNKKTDEKPETENQEPELKKAA
ncbi:MAG: hypothetical protein ACE5FU_10985 [Nitrospinota bacterium]